MSKKVFSIKMSDFYLVGIQNIKLNLVIYLFNLKWSANKIIN